MCSVNQKAITLSAADKPNGSEKKNIKNNQLSAEATSMVRVEAPMVTYPIRLAIVRMNTVTEIEGNTGTLTSSVVFPLYW